MSHHKNSNFSSLLTEFEGNLTISDSDDGFLRSVRKEVRGVIRRDFSAGVGAFLRERNATREMIDVAMQLSEERVKFLTQGSYQYKTLNKPQHPPRQQMDLDDGIYFQMPDVAHRKLLPSDLLFSFVESRVAPLAEQNGWEMHHKPTCIRLYIDAKRNDKHVDLPMYIVPAEEFPDFQEDKGRTQEYADIGMRYRPSVGEGQIWMAHREKQWEQSDPRQIIDWVLGCKRIHGKHFKTLCRVMKAWRDCQWKDSPLSSICIMRMVEMALKAEGHVAGAGVELDSLLYAVVRRMHSTISNPKSVTDPTDQSKHLDKKVDETGERENIKRQLRILVDVLHDVLFMEGEKEEKNAKLCEQFGKFFPSKSFKIVRCAGAVPLTSNVSQRPTPSPYCATEK